MCEECGCGDTQTEQSFEEKVKEMIEVIRPMLQGHGGDMELIEVSDENKTVSVRLQGACSGCPGAKATLKNGVEQMMKEKIPELTEVIAVE